MLLLLLNFCSLFEDILKIAGILISDKEDLIQKTVGWMLREVGKRTIEIEENFLEEHYKEMTRTMLSYSIEKFPENTKRELFGMMDLDELKYAVKGLEQETVDTIIAWLPAKKQAMYEPVEGAVSKRDVDRTRKIIVDAAKVKEKEGEINIEDLLGGADMVE